MGNRTHYLRIQESNDAQTWNILGSFGESTNEGKKTYTLDFTPTKNYLRLYLGMTATSYTNNTEVYYNNFSITDCTAQAVVDGGVGNKVAFKYRIHDASIGRFLSTDPLKAQFSYNSPYAFSENRVIDRIELEGAETAILPYVTENTGYRTAVDNTRDVTIYNKYQIQTYEHHGVPTEVGSTTGSYHPLTIVDVIKAVNQEFVDFDGFFGENLGKKLDQKALGVGRDMQAAGFEASVNQPTTNFGQVENKISFFGKSSTNVTLQNKTVASAKLNTNNSTSPNSSFKTDAKFSFFMDFRSDNSSLSGVSSDISKVTSFNIGPLRLSKSETESSSQYYVGFGLRPSFSARTGYQFNETVTNRETTLQN